MAQKALTLLYPPGATPLDPDELEGLIPDHVTTREDLNELEQVNIASALRWASRAAIKKVADEDFLYLLHQKMFGDVWAWAGKPRTSDKNIGVSSHQVGAQLKNLCLDTIVWIEKGVFPSDEIAARFHHKLVWIHPFANGNGRHARMAADLLLERVLGRPAFTWGSVNLLEVGEVRARYIESLRAADAHNYGPLFDFVRT